MKESTLGNSALKELILLSVELQGIYDIRQRECYYLSSVELIASHDTRSTFCHITYGTANALVSQMTRLLMSYYEREFI